MSKRERIRKHLDRCDPARLQDDHRRSLVQHYQTMSVVRAQEAKERPNARSNPSRPKMQSKRPQFGLWPVEQMRAELRRIVGPNADDFTNQYG